MDSRRAGIVLLVFTACASGSTGELLSEEDIHLNCYGYSYGREGLSLDYTKAHHWCRRSAELGIPSSQTLYAELFYQGRGTPVNFDLAAFWYLEAASQGHPHAIIMVARMQAREQGPELDREELVRWLEEAAANGSLAAEQALYELPDP